MTRSRVERAVARATGESLNIVKRLGFGVIEPKPIGLDDGLIAPSIVDWDALQQQRIGLLPNRQQARPAG